MQLFKAPLEDFLNTRQEIFKTNLSNLFQAYKDKEELENEIEGLCNVYRLKTITVSKIPLKISVKEFTENQWLYFRHEVTGSFEVLKFHPYSNYPFINVESFYDRENDKDYIQINTSYFNFNKDLIFKDYLPVLKRVLTIVADLNSEIYNFNQLLEEIKTEEIKKYERGFDNVRPFLDDLNNSFHIIEEYLK